MEGPISYLQNHAGRIKQCSEKRLGCNTSEVNTEGCCAIVACRYCVTWTEYGEAAVADMTSDGDGMWMATPGGVAFLMYWERDQYTDDCELVVTFDGEEVYRKSCYEGQSCRDSSDEVEVATAYLTGTLRWDKDLKRQLPTVRDYETNCIRQMCSGCNCTCECLCVTITEDYGATEVATGEICDTAYDCDPPIWSGTVGDYEITVSLDSDCAISATVDGQSKSATVQEGTTVCNNFTVTIEVGDGRTITLTCKECTCVVEEPCLSCCNGTYSTASRYLTFTLLNATPRCACLDGFVMELTYVGVIRNELGECEVRWEGRAARPCPAGLQFNAIFICRDSLDNTPPSSELEVYLDNGEGTAQTDFFQGAFDYYSSACDPFSYCVRSVNGNWLADVGECGDASVDETEPELELCVTL